MRFMRIGLAPMLGGLVLASGAHGFVTTVDFSTDDNGNAIVHGQKIDSEYFTLFSLSTSGSNQGAAAFDSDLAGPTGDPDLLVGLGNVLIFQNNANPAITGGVFHTPNDATNTGTWTFDFTTTVAPLSIDLVDIDASASMSIVLTDQGGLTRTFTVPSNWTKDIDVAGPDGYDTLDLTTLLSQLGEGGATATASELAGFDGSLVVRLDVTLRGSGAIDNLRFDTRIPGPGPVALVAVAGVAGLRRRR